MRKTMSLSEPDAFYPHKYLCFSQFHHFQTKPSKLPGIETK